jgi:hypothetical protein
MATALDGIVDRRRLHGVRFGGKGERPKVSVFSEKERLTKLAGGETRLLGPMSHSPSPTALARDHDGQASPTMVTSSDG